MAVLSAIALLPALATAQNVSRARSAASALMRRRLYKDAVTVLEAQIKKLTVAQAGRENLMLGESYYALKDHARARAAFLKARANLPGGQAKLLAEYRLACIAYRTGDVAGALRMIDAFVEAHSLAGHHARTLLVFKMKILARGPKTAAPELEAIREQIGKATAGKASVQTMAADNVLTNFYLRHHQPEKAQQRYVSIVHGTNNVIIGYRGQQKRVPRELEQTHDNAAMQLGIIALKNKKFLDAVKWFQNVQYDQKLMRESKLRVAQVYYQQRNFSDAIASLTQGGFLDTVPTGTLRSDMCLVLGLCEKAKPGANPLRVENYLRQVGTSSRGYFQAQMILADIYRDRGLTSLAIKAYEISSTQAKYEAPCFYNLGELYLAIAGTKKDRATEWACYEKAAAYFSKLSSKHPSSPLIKRAGRSIDQLRSKGVKVEVATSDEEKARQWLNVVKDQRGKPVAARALMGLARLYFKTVMDEKGKAYVKAPDYPKSVAVCSQLLDRKVYTGEGLTAAIWNGLRVEAKYYRGMGHLSSLAPPKAAAGPVKPIYVKKPSINQAVTDFTEARQEVDAKRLDLVKNLDLALLEAMFKSDSPEHQKTAAARFAQLSAEYGTDVRFQRLAMELAEWFRRQGRFADAAREYKGIADRGKNLTQDDLLRSLFMAGKLYSEAAHQARTHPGRRRFGLYIRPEEVFKPVDLLKTHEPLKKYMQINWPDGVKSVPAEHALKLVSEASGIPFVWDPAGGPNAISTYLKTRRVDVDKIGGSVASFLVQILDLPTDKKDQATRRHRLAIDIGLTGTNPNVKPKPADTEDPDAKPVQIIEIYDVRNADRRYKPLAVNYGPFRTVHGKNAMIFHVVARIEKLTATKILWGEGVEKEDVLATEYTQVPGLAPGSNCSAAEALRAMLKPLNLHFKVLPRDESAELYDLAKDCFNELRKIDPKSGYGEKSLFQLALNFFRQQDYERMRVVLREYLKVFDSPASPHYHEACFWVGWVFEHDKLYRDAVHWYNQAAEEGLVVYRPAKDEKRTTRDEFRSILSYETMFALEEPVTGKFTDYQLGGRFAEFIRMNANVSLRVDATAAEIKTPITRPTFVDVQAFDVLWDALDGLGLGVRVENVNPKVSEKAYYRLASAYKKDALLPQALASCNVLLDRFPKTQRRRDTIKLRLDIYKALKDYRKVLITLEELRVELGDDVEAYKIDYEIAQIYFDLCRYKEAAEAFKRAMGGAKASGDRVNIRDGYARTLFRLGDLPAALGQYRVLLDDETGPVRRFIDELMVWYLEVATAKRKAYLPPEADKLMKWYLKLDDRGRGGLSKNMVAKVTWVYYVSALADLKKGHTDKALIKLAAAGNSTDDSLAAEAIYLIARIRMKAGDWKKAKEDLEYMLLTTKAAEAEIKATYQLGVCCQKLDEPEKAKARFDRILSRFPDSAYAERVRADRGQTDKKKADKKDE